MSLKKQYVKTSGKCKVTFRLPKEAALDAQLVNIVGDFNNWSITETPMQKLKNGDYKIVLELNSEREYKFRYLIDATKWENDWSADKYIPNGFGGEDSVVVV
ncbi:MAG: isoamylase early set domain-containing protein [Nitrospira sp.]|nr:isoamylase early set domain-containing protein [bacterium]MBL7048117.1 isoamylase early set domain-containing protein [Nitrospira sp.]